jgi:hypothetical protein
MEAIIFAIVLVWAVRKAAENGHLSWQGSKAGNRRGSRGKSIPKRAASAVQHDVGYWAHQILNGFPAARRGLANGWHAGRTAQAQSAAERQQRKAEHLETRVRLIPEIREHRRRQAEAWERICGDQQPEQEFPVLLTGRSRSGRPVNPLTGEPHDTVAVWDQEDLDRRLAAAAEDPDMKVTTRPVPDPASEAGTPEGTSPETSQPTSTTEEGTQMASDVTYDGVLRAMDKAVMAAEDHGETARAAHVQASGIADQMQALEVDPATLGAMADHLDALDAAAKAQQQVLDTARSVHETLQRGHAQLAEAHKEAVVEAADKAFYTD